MSERNKDKDNISDRSLDSQRLQYAGLRRHSQETNDLVKECLRTAMTRLAMQKDYKDITVSALCKEAGVSRMGFYRNYSVVNDVIYEIAYKLNSDVIAIVGSPFRNSTSLEWYIATFRLMADYKEEMALMFQENFQHEWMRIVNNFAVHSNDFSMEKKYQRVMWCGGFENAVAYWLNNGMRESPEEMADYCMRYLPHLLQTKDEKTIP